MDANLILMMVQDKLPKDPMSVMNLRDRLGKMSDAKRDEFARQLPILGLKNPTLVFWVGSFLFGNLGVGRFMIGDMGLGAARLGLNILIILPWIFAGAAISSDRDIGYIISAIVPISTLVIYLAQFIWWIVDLFIVGKKLRQQNLDKILRFLDQNK